MYVSTICIAIAVKDFLYKEKHLKEIMCLFDLQEETYSVFSTQGTCNIIQSEDYYQLLERLIEFCLYMISGLKVVAMWG